MTSTVVYQGELRTLCTHLASKTEINTDAPVDNQGKGEAFSPTDLLATSLAACALTIMGIKGRDLQLDLSQTRVEVEKTMKANPRRIGGLKLTFHFPKTVGADEHQRLLVERCAHTCPVFYSIHPDIDVDIRFDWE